MELSAAPKPALPPVEPPAGALAYVRALPRRHRLAVAAAGAALAVLCFVRFGVSGRASVDAVVAVALVLLAAIDLDRRLLPNAIVLPVLGFVLPAQIALFPDRTVEWLLASVGAALFLFLPLIVYPAGMGLGDVKMAALLGAALGKAVVGAFVAGLFAAAVVAAVVLARGGRDARRTAIPFGPFLAFGALLALFVGGR
jgi:leader peptidase (prepilin peptidase)/N-methyltransferase